MEVAGLISLMGDASPIVMQGLGPHMERIFRDAGLESIAKIKLFSEEKARTGGSATDAFHELLSTLAVPKATRTRCLYFFRKLVGAMAHDVPEEHDCIICRYWMLQPVRMPSGHHVCKDCCEVLAGKDPFTRAAIPIDFRMEVDAEEKKKIWNSVTFVVSQEMIQYEHTVRANMESTLRGIIERNKLSAHEIHQFVPISNVPAIDAITRRDYMYSLRTMFPEFHVTTVVKDHYAGPFLTIILKRKELSAVDQNV